ncbi:MAG: hypothetical protein U1F66_07035 [bacterium]
MNEQPACAQCQSWLEDEFSRELAPELRPRLEVHLQGCAECRALWQDYQTLRRGMDLIAETEGPSLRAQNAVLRAAEERAERRAPRVRGLWAWLLRPATVAFATLLLIVGIGYLGRQELQKRKASESPAPLLAPQGTPADEGMGLIAPAPSGFKDGEIEKRKQAPAGAGAASKTAPRPPAKPQAPPPAAAEAVRERSPAPPPPPAADQALPAAAPTKSLAQPPAPMSGAEAEAPAARSAPLIPEAATGLGGAKPEAEGKKDGGALKKSVPASEAQDKESFQAETNLQGGRLEEKAKEPADRFNALLSAAKAKLAKQDYAGALEDLLAAQRIRDSKEVQDLILLCRSHLRGDG